MGAVQHTGVLLYLRFPGTSVNKQHVLRGLQFQSTCTKVLESRAEAGTERKSILTKARSWASRVISETKENKDRNRRNSAPEADKTEKIKRPQLMVLTQRLILKGSTLENSVPSVWEELYKEESTVVSVNYYVAYLYLHIVFSMVYSLNVLVNSTVSISIKRKQQNQPKKSFHPKNQPCHSPDIPQKPKQQQKYPSENGLSWVYKARICNNQGEVRKPFKVLSSWIFQRKPSFSLHDPISGIFEKFGSPYSTHTTIFVRARLAEDQDKECWPT